MSDYDLSEDDLSDEWAVETRAVRSGISRSAQREHSEAIYLTSSYVYDSAAHAAAVFSGIEPGNVYSRYNNPSVRMFEERMAALEEGEDACAMASGMACILGTCMGLLKSGDHVVCSRSVFGTTYTVFVNYLARFGVSTTFVDFLDEQQWLEAMRPNTRLLFLETPSNPLGDVVDIQRMADIAHTHDALLMVDNCFCSPILQQPLKLGADLVMHSATKFLDGQGRCMGGIVVGNKELVKEIQLWGRAAGACLSAFDAWVFNKGLETLAIRMEAHCRNTRELAFWLDEHPGVEQVFYSGLESHPGHALAKKQQKDFGGVFSFAVKGGREQAWQVIDQVQIISRTANLGDARSTITHPATTTHCRLSPEDKARSGITDNLVRVAPGFENINDLKKDLDRGLSLV